MMLKPNTVRDLLLMGILLPLGAALAAPYASAEALRIQTFKTHGRLALSVDESVPVEWKNGSRGFEILLKGIALTDLGVPSGQQEEWKANFRAAADPRLAGLSFEETASGVLIRGQWKYPIGRNAPAVPAMETFEYREKAPRYVVDFWWKSGPTVSEVESARARVKKAQAESKARMESKQRADRRLASQKTRQEAESAVQGFCAEPLKDSTDVFLSFLPFHEKIDFGRWFSAKVPDENYSYFIPEAKTRDAQYVRLALELYKQGKPALTVRTLEFFEREHPGSEFRYEMRLLKASALVKLGLSGESDEILSQLVIDAKDSPVGLHSAMFLANSRFQKGSHLAAMESFFWLANRHPKHSLNWVFHLGAAESLYLLKQTERAAKEYQWVIENAPSDSDKAEAAIRVGDLYMDRFQYEQALASYYESLSHFQEQVKGFPSVFVNRAEALYQLGQYDRAKDAFSQFLEKHPGHPSGWRAAFRLGEISGRKGGEQARAESRHWFNETINRFPFSPGATLARMRLVPCGDQGGFDLAGMERFFREDAARFDGAGEIQMKRYGTFKALSQVRALVTLGHDDQAVTLALRELAQPANSAAQPYLGKIVNFLFRKTILQLLENGKKYEALAFYHERKEMLLKDSGNDFDYLLALSRAGSDLGLGSVGKELAELYDKSVSKSPRNGGRMIAAEQAADDLEEQARASEQRFARAKANWVSQNGASSKIPAAAASEIRNLLAGVTDESRYSFEKYVILSLLEEREGNFTAALAHAAKAQVLAPESAAKDRDLALRLEAHVAMLQVGGGDSRMALELLRALEQKIGRIQGAGGESSVVASSLGLAPAPSLEALVIAEAGALEKLGRWSEAAVAYEKAIEKGWSGDRAVFGNARALLKTGTKVEVEKGRTAMRKLASGAGDGFWKKLAAETLANDTKRDAKEGGQ
ncbi:MAG: hypothetical protein A2X94_06915 [Bdellovibrionales bacterium GWB1_55_8]|nr:MAG: hypothetical protein A2X94_06915 [Bdellovibrionales bacterium GWB1_55_8]